MDSTNVFKSNIDVYLCTELFSDIFDKLKPIHLVIFSCDGDYAEMIKKALDLNSHLSVSVFATPYTRHNKYLSSRLQELVGYSARYHLVNIENIKDKIKK
jgi:hypothetical protein